MTRMLKTLGLSLMAVMALGAFVASAAQAHYHIDGAADTVHAVGPLPTKVENHFSVYTRTGGKLNVVCHKNEFEITHESSEASTTEELTVHPVYGECELGGLEAEVDTTGCDYHFDKPTTIGTDETTAEVSITCEAGHEIVISSVGCEVTVKGPQETLKHVVFKNTHPETGVDDVDATATVTGITYTMHAGCPKVEGASETRSDGEYFEDLTVTASNEGTPVGITVT